MKTVNTLLFAALFTFSFATSAAGDYRIKMLDEHINEEKLRGTPETYIFLKGGELAYYSRGLLADFYNQLNAAITEGNISYTPKTDAHILAETNARVEMLGKHISKNMRAKNVSEEEIQKTISEYEKYWRIGFMKRPQSFSEIMEQSEFESEAQKNKIISSNETETVFLTFYTDWCEACEKQKNDIVKFKDSNPQISDKTTWLYIERDGRKLEATSDNAQH
ncbi:thioredoxin domain-containing protein [Teredinibacter purpureus]|jgi:hypothetical protein|uniref:hypothetical protein n=1 Tax=Teredinibacter purpureus TaxID=2731756 RepID=UPI0005F7C726|nr:hypothetical protein [Teredinibacter purpureus]